MENEIIINIREHGDLHGTTLSGLDEARENWKTRNDTENIPPITAISRAVEENRIVTFSTLGKLTAIGIMSHFAMDVPDNFVASFYFFKFKRAFKFSFKKSRTCLSSRNHS